MTEGQKIHKLLKFAIETDPNRFGWTDVDLLPAFENELNVYEIQHLGRQIINNGDAADCISKDGFEIGINEKSKAAFYSKKYLKEFSKSAVTSQPTIQIGTVQQVVSSTVHGGFTQSSDSSINKIKTISAKADNSMIKKILIGIGVGVIVGLILYYIFGIQ